MILARVYQAMLLESQKQILLDEKASHHLARVLRAKVHDQLILFNGEGGEYLAEIVRIDKKNVTVQIESHIQKEVESSLHLHLAQGIARGEKMDFIVQKAVELGVKRITPLITERCNIPRSNDYLLKRMAHWQAIIISACEQSGRNVVPELARPILLHDWLQTIKADLAFVLSPHVADRLPNMNLPIDANIVLLLGPEGGLSEEEIQEAMAGNFRPLNLGPRVLRTETATIAALTALQYRYGDMGER